MADMNVRQQEIVVPPEAGQARGPHEQRRRRTTKVIAGASTTEAIVGAGAAVLAIVGLAGIFPTAMAPIAAIAVGAALLSEGAAAAAQYSELMSRSNGSRYEGASPGAGMSTQMFGGIAGVTLGVLALLGIAPFALLSIAVIVFGASILLGTAAPMQVETMVERHHEQEPHPVAQQAVQAAEGGRVLVGIASAVLGILVLTGVGDPLTLTLSALLTVGAAEFLGGSTLGARLGMALRSNR